MQLLLSLRVKSLVRLELDAKIVALDLGLLLLSRPGDAASGCSTQAGAGGCSSTPLMPAFSVFSDDSLRAGTFVFFGLLYASFLFLPNPIQICGTRQCQWAVST